MRLASRGRREIEGRTERIEDDGLREALRRRALVIVAQSLMIAIAVTIAVSLVARRQHDGPRDERESVSASSSPG